MFYSKSTGFFYKRQIHGDSIPADAVEITSELHAALLAAQSAGKIIAADENGHPVLADAPAETEAAARDRALSTIRTERNPILDALAGIGFDAMVAGDSATVTAVSAARQAALDITALPAFLAATTYADMKAAIMAEWYRMAAAAPINVQTAFREVLG